MYFFRVKLNNSSQSNKEMILGLDTNITKSKFEAILYKNIEEAIEDRIKEYDGTKAPKPTLNMLWNNIVRKFIEKGFEKIECLNEEVFDGDIDLLNKHTSILNNKLTSHLLRKGYK